MQSFHAFLLRISKWYVWLFFFMGYLILAGYFMPSAATKLETACGEGIKIPDIEIGYNAAELKEMIAFMNEDCRKEYLFISKVTDSFYPIFYGFFFLFSIVFLYYKGKEPFRMPGLYLLPLVAFVFDFVENATLTYIVRHPNDFSEGTANMASAFSMLKWLFVLLGMLLLLLGIGRVVVNRFK